MDVYEEIIDHEANLFYDNVRTFIVVFLTVAVLLPTSYVLLNSRRKNKEACLSKDDVTVQNFVLLVCMITMSLCVMMVFMLPLSILANEVLILSPNRYYVQWINTGLLRAFFVLVRVTFKGTCFLIPFGFFFLGSHSVHKGSKGISSRCFYSILYVAITYIGLFGSLTIFISTVLDTLNSSNFTNIESTLTNFVFRACFSSPLFCYSWPIQFLGDIICCIDGALLFTQQSVSYTGLALLLVCMPSGICGIISKMISISSSAQPRQPTSLNVYHTQVTDERYRVKLEKCLKYIKALNRPFLHQTNQLGYQIISDSDSSYQLSSDETSGSLELSDVPYRTPCSVISAIAFILLLFMFLASAVCASVNVIVTLYSLLLPRGEETNGHASVSDYILLGHESVSKFGFIGACLQALMVTFVISTSVIGFYSLPLVSKYIYPQYRGTTMTLLLFNTTCILVISSAVPLHASLLGLVTPSFPPVYYSSFLDDGFCRPASDPCFRPSSSALSLFPPESLKQSLSVKQQTCSSVSSYTQSGPLREDDYSMHQHQILVSGIPPNRQPTSPLVSSIPLRTGSKWMALSYSFVFLIICYWLLHKRGREFMQIRDQLASVWLVAVHWWLGTASKKENTPPTTVAPPNSTSPTAPSSITTLS